MDLEWMMSLTRLVTTWPMASPTSSCACPPRCWASCRAHALRSEELLEHLQHRRRFVRVEHAQAFGQADFVDRAELVDDDLAVLAGESHVHAGWIGVARGGEWRDDHSANVPIHLVRRDDDARAGRADLAANGGVEVDEEHI